MKSMAYGLFQFIQNISFISLICRHTPPSLPSHPSSSTLSDSNNNTNPSLPSFPSSSSSSPLCHLLGYEISFFPNMNLKFFQDMKLSFSILDIKNFIFEQNLFLCCLGNDQKIHFYEIDSLSGTLSRNSKRAKKAREILSLRMKTKRTRMTTEDRGKESSTALPLRFALEDWFDGGSQCLVGYIDGHLHWDRQVEKRVRVTATAAAVAQQQQQQQPHQEHQHKQRQQGDEEKSMSSKRNKKENYLDIDIPDPFPSSSSLSSSHSHSAEQNAPLSPPLPLPHPAELPKSPETPEAPPLEITSPISTQRSYDASDLMTIAEGSDEDEDGEDSVDSTLRQYRRQSAQPTQPPQNPYRTMNLHPSPSSSSLRSPPGEGIWDDMMETDDPPPPAGAGDVAGENSNSQVALDAKLFEIYSKVFLHDPVRTSILPSMPLSTAPASSTSASSSLLYSTVTKRSSYSYLLHGSISCLQFYQREATQIRSFRQKYSSSSSSLTSPSPLSPPSCLSPPHPPLLSPHPHPTLQSQSSHSSTQLKWKDSFRGRTHEPSSCVLVGSSEGSLALLSLERKIIQCSTYDEATESLQSHWCWEGDDDDEEEQGQGQGHQERGEVEENPNERDRYVMKSIFISSPSSCSSSSSPQASWGSILCVCVADVTGNGLNDVIVGYDTGLVRVLSILDSAPFPSSSAPADASSASGPSGTLDPSSLENDSQTHHQFHQPMRTPSHSADHYDFEEALLSSSSFPSFSPSPSSSSLTMNSEGWSVSNSSFHEICQLQLPFPVLAIEYGQYLGGDGTVRTETEEDFEEERGSIGGRGCGGGGMSSMSLSLGPMNHLVIVTTKSFHVWVPVPVRQRKKREMEQTGGAEAAWDSPGGDGSRGVSEQERRKVKEETLEVLEAKKKFIVQILEQLDELGEITSQTAGA
jgi:hypothetical protein